MMWVWLEQWLRGTRPPARRTWRPKIQQRQWLNPQELYGGGYNRAEPEEEIDVRDLDPEEDLLLDLSEELGRNRDRGG